MGGMYFQPAYTDFLQTSDFDAGIVNIFRMHGTETQQAAWISGTIFRAPVVDFGSESDHVRADVIDDPGALDFRAVQEVQEIFRAGGIFHDLVVIATAMANQFVRRRLQHLVRLNMDVNVYDRRQSGFL